MNIVVLLFILLAGMILGSFFNVLIIRLPNDELLKYPRSLCPFCGHRIRFYDNIPVLSFLLLKGKCRDCKAPISWQYPLVEVGAAVLAVWLFHIQDWRLDQSWLIVSQGGTIFILLFLIPVSVIDFRHRIIPDGITLGGLCLGLLLSLLPGGISILDSLLGVICGGGVLYAIGFIGERILKKEAMGGGDVKLMAMAGSLLGAKGVLLALFFGSLIGSVMGIIIKIKQKESYLPFGPALAAGILISFCFGRTILNWYLSLL